MATLTFHGASEQVTGSCYLVDTGNQRILLECGLFQGNREVEAQNAAGFSFDVNSLDAVILSHAHLDHSGRLPLLVKQGYRGPIYVSRPTRDLLEIMLKDAAFLELKDTDWENKRRLRSGKEPIEPLYTLEDVEQALSQCRPCKFSEWQSLNPGIKFQYHLAGHIIGAAIVDLRLEHGGNSRRLVFSGDLGNHCSPLLQDPAIIDSADLLLMESTYGDRDHKSLAATLEEFETALQAADENGGNVLIPSFAVGRTQDLIYWLGVFHRKGQLRQHMVFIDSPMGISASEVYEQYAHQFNDDDPEFKREIQHGWQAWLPSLRYTRHTEESMMLNNIERGAIIIAGSGMCTGGRIRHHLKHNLWRRRAHVIIVGYQAYGTLGRALVDGAQSVSVMGNDIAVKAQIHTLGGFSAHAGQTQLLQWASGFKQPPTQTYLVHGEERALNSLRSSLHGQLNWNVRIARHGESVDF